MKISKVSVLLPFVFAMGFSLFSMPAHAQATRTWVSGVGSDANPCSRTAPCKTFAGAISKTAPGGEIDALDPGGFGAVTITKAITLDGGGGQVASILVAGTNAINVNAGASDVVILRNLRFDGLNQSVNPGLTAIQFNSGGTLIVEKCDIFGFNNDGIGIVPTNNSKVSISETHIQNTAVAANTAGVRIAPTANVTVMISKSWVELSGQNGIFANGGGAGVIRLNVKESVVTHTGGTGVQVTSGGTSVVGEVTGTQISYAGGAGTAVAGGSASLTLGENTITNNVTGVSAPSGTLLSYKNNMIADNGSNGTPITAVTGYTNGGQ
ncbi:MAG TPA: right-handed parallel beta-helix repeat-containing protein [Xanthobacteraceae bacterium]|jgi:hypothetical protein|nr:right-handed parallel beta-helix repeat-containing protein [Xanthobacteraceae bacterium]